MDIMESKELIEKELNFINKFDFNQGRMEKDLLLVSLRNLIRKHIDFQKKDEVMFLLDLKHNYNHEGESYKQITERLNDLQKNDN
jgi:hypothetical protein